MNIKIRFGAANYKRIKPYLLAVDQQEDQHFTFSADGFMPLSIEYLGYSDADGHPVYSLMHYYIQNGDLMRDPDMTISVNDAARTARPAGSSKHSAKPLACMAICNQSKRPAGRLPEPPNRY